MEKILLDTNVILDIALKRIPHFNDAVKLFQMVDNHQVMGFVTASTITDIYYIAKREKGHQTTLEFITDLIEFIEVIGVDKQILVSAIHSEMRDFEDAVQVSAAEFNTIDFLITRNVKDFVSSRLQVISPNDFLKIKREN